jgi:soluble cytochrome b562
MVMLDLSSIKEIVSQLSWLLTLGASETKHVKTQLEELVHHLSASLVSLWDATCEITRLTEADFTKDRFEVVHDYFFSFYLAPGQISKARTHCAEVKRDIQRIKFKLARILHTDVGKWADAEERFRRIVDEDGIILSSYQHCMDELKRHLDTIHDSLKQGNLDAAKRDYFSLKNSLRDDIAEMDQGVKTMEATLEHIRGIIG